jgi:hypothetical protein
MDNSQLRRHRPNKQKHLKLIVCYAKVLLARVHVRPAVLELEDSPMLKRLARQCFS